MPRLLLLCIAAGLVRLSSQFGNVQVQWDAAQPRVQTNEAVPASFKAPLNVRRSALHELPIEKLSEIFSGLRPGLTCNACTTTGHWISEIRAACLEASPKALKAGLQKRGVRCEGCTMREHYLDRLLDSVHLPVR